MKIFTKNCVRRGKTVRISPSRFDRLVRFCVDPTEISDAFVTLANLFDELDEHFATIFEQFQRLEIPAAWLQSPLFNWQQTNMNNEMHRRFLKNFFIMTKINTMRQLCQLALDHSQALESKRAFSSKKLGEWTCSTDLQLPIVQDADLLSVIQQYISLFTVQYVRRSLDVRDTSTFAVLADRSTILCDELRDFVLRSRCQCDLGNDVDSERFAIPRISSSSLSDHLDESSERTATVSDRPAKALGTDEQRQARGRFQRVGGEGVLWKNFRQMKISAELRRIRRHSLAMQLTAFRWQNVQLLRSAESLEQRQLICDELTTVNPSTFVQLEDRVSLVQDQNILAVADPTYRQVLEKMLNLEQTALRQLRWAAGANPSVAEALNKFETRQKERLNEIEVGRGSTNDKFISHFVF